MPFLTFRRPLLAAFAFTFVVAITLRADDAMAAKKDAPAAADRFKPPKEEKAWIDGKGMCLFPFGAEKLPDSSEDFAAAMEKGYRRALKLPEDSSVVVATGGTYPIVDTLRIDVCDAVIDPNSKARKPNDRQLAIHGLDAAHFELLGQRMTVEDATLNLNLSATDARLLFTRDKSGKPLLMMGSAKSGKMSLEMTFDDVERLLLTAARRGGRPYGLIVDRTRLKMDVEEGRIVRVDLKLNTRFAFVPAGLHFTARLDIDEHLNAKLSDLSCTGDEVLGPLISKLIRPAITKYNNKTRPLMNFPKTELRLQGVEIVAGERVRLTANFGS